jgi:hypothetical protein
MAPGIEKSGASESKDANKRYTAGVCRPVIEDGLDVTNDDVMNDDENINSRPFMHWRDRLLSRWTRSIKAAVVRQESSARIIRSTVHSYVTVAPEGERGSD